MPYKDIIMNTELLFSLANALFLLGTLFLLKGVIKNRAALKDYDFLGSIINFVGMSTSLVALAALAYYTTILISLPTTIFWGIASIYSFKNRKIKK